MNAMTPREPQLITKLFASVADDDPEQDDSSDYADGDLS